MQIYTNIILALLFIAGNVFSSDSYNPEYSHYNINLEIKPSEQFIKVSGTLKYIINQDSLENVSFNLHRNLEISSFIIDGDDAYLIDTSKSEVRWLPDAIKIIHTPKKKYMNEDILNIEFSYEGVVDEWPGWSANVITPDWVEIGLYFPWYPAGDGLFTYNLTVDIESGYSVFAIGDMHRDGNKTVFENDRPVYDLIVCASKNLSVRRTELLDKSFKIVNSTLSDNIIDSMQTDIENTYNIYTDWFGNIDAYDMCLVISGRKKGGGYSRIGGLFLGGLTDSAYLQESTDILKYISHEVAHFWWNGAPGSWEDWLNESFAEYSALRLIRKLRGDKEFRGILNSKRDANKNTPPVWGIARNDPQAEQVLYGKAVVFLYELEEKVGKTKFEELCRDRVKNRIRSTEDFLNLLKDVDDIETAEWFRQRLKSC